MSHCCSLSLPYLPVSPGAICPQPSISTTLWFTLKFLSYPQLSFTPPVPCLTLGWLSVQAPWDCRSNQAHAPIRANMTFQVLALSGVTFKNEWLSGKLRLMCTVMEDNVNLSSGLHVLYVWESHLSIASLINTITHCCSSAINCPLFLSVSVFLFFILSNILSVPLFSLNNTLTYLFYCTVPFLICAFSKAWSPTFFFPFWFIIQYCLLYLLMFPCILFAHFSSAGP